MPSGITHIILSKFVLDRISNKSKNDEKYKNLPPILRRNLGAFILGSVAPDLPYISLGDGKVADDLHYIKTNEVPQCGFAEAAQLVKDGNTSRAEALFCFSAGHYSHLVADGLMHPYVRDKVGDYDVAKKPHRILEMKLDVLIARDHFGVEVNGTHFQDELDWIRDSKFKSEIFSSFAGNISNIYNCAVMPEDVKSWWSAMQTVFDAVEGEFPKWYRDLIGDHGCAFKNCEDIKGEEVELTTLDLPIDAATKGLATNFTGKKEKITIKNVIDKYFNIFPDRVISAYESVFDGQGDVQIPAINLDTGRSLDSKQLSDVPVFWR
ncbi:MAG: hypothetical protein A3K09_04975 [Nitrospinae bacterium RIFCSPLOWO2_12_FULL_47_7]|nr:MAG: hypothetical protein A3K09_04975 [Nitrospinae bacterium RIFCSPLOWO2_12_FULL_47_7]